VTLYGPGFNDTVVPPSPPLPGKELGEGLLPETVMVKSDGFLLPMPLLMIFLTTIRFATVGVG
jgi:hypothetical protein